MNKIETEIVTVVNLSQCFVHNKVTFGASFKLLRPNRAKKKSITNILNPLTSKRGFMRNLGISQLYDCDVICFGDMGCLLQSASETGKYLTITLRNRAEYCLMLSRRGRRPRCTKTREHFARLH